MSKRQALEAECQRLTGLADTLQRYTKEAKSLWPAFEKMTDETAERIKAHGRKWCEWYLKSWFRCYLGVKDECMILINGELVRAYHKKMHGAYFHERPGEKRYYNNDCALTGCCVDGLDFEYRRASNKFGSRSSLDRIADMSQAQSDVLNPLSQDIEETIETITAALRSIGAANIKTDRRHYGEVFEVSFEKPPQRIQLLGSSSLRSCSREIALRTIVDDPEELNILRLQKKRSRLDDSDDEEDVDTASESERNREVSISIDAIKRQYMAPVEEPVESESRRETNENHVEPADGFDERQSRYRWAIDTTIGKSLPLHSLFGAAIYSVHTVRVKVMNPFQRRLNPSKPIPKGFSSHVWINVELRVPRATTTTAADTKPIVVCRSLFEEITRLLWQTPAVVNSSIDKSFMRLWLPEQLRIDQQLIPRLNDNKEQHCLLSELQTGPVIVTCAEDDCSLDFMDSLAEYCVENGPSELQERMDLIATRLTLLAKKQSTLLRFRQLLLEPDLKSATKHNKCEESFPMLSMESPDDEVACKLDAFLARHWLSVHPNAPVRFSGELWRASKSERSFWHLCCHFPRVQVCARTFVVHRYIETASRMNTQSIAVSHLNLSTVDWLSHCDWPAAFHYGAIQYAALTIISKSQWASIQTISAADSSQNIDWAALMTAIGDCGDPLTEFLLLLLTKLSLRELLLGPCKTSLFSELLMCSFLLKSLRVHKHSRGLPSQVLFTFTNPIHSSCSQIWNTLLSICRVELLLDSTPNQLNRVQMLL